MTDEVIEGHLRGRHTIGVYPIRADDTCRFLAADFDRETWRRDAEAFLGACRSQRIPAALERSRSGDGGHVWIFFDDPLPASVARRLGAHLLTEAMEGHPDIGFGSYDRFFPSQDTLPEGGFGNLIALPLQGGPRRDGNTRVPCRRFRAPPRPVGLSLVASAPVRSGSHGDRRRGHPEGRAVPERIEAVLGDQLYIPRAGLPSGLVNRLIRLAAFQNPAFYSAQAMRRSTFGIPRIVACAELPSHHVALPRGCREAMESMLEELGTRMDVRDVRNPGNPVDTDWCAAGRWTTSSPTTVTSWSTSATISQP